MLRLQALGGLTLLDGAGAAVAIQRRRLALLALLAVAGSRGLTRDKLVAYLWPESPAENARHALEQLLYALRRQLGEHLFLGADPLRLNPDMIASDVRAFEAALERGAAAEAVALYKGAFLDGFYIGEAGEFERWVEAKRSQLAADHRRALEQLAGEEQRRGNHMREIELRRKLVFEDPLSARAALGLMQGLVAGGDQSGALQHALAYERLVRQELDGEPDPAVTEFVRRLRRPPLPTQPQTALEAPHSLPTTSRPFIAILPFEYAGSDPDQEFLGQAFAEEIRSTLSEVDGLRVASRIASLPFGKDAVDLQAVRRELAVDAVLEGTVDHRGGQVRITARLRTVDDGRVLWADAYERDAADMFALQERLVRAIVGALRITLAADAQLVVKRHTEDPEAYNLYLKGRFHWNKRPRETLKGLEYLHQAIERDPLFARAYAGIADAYNTLGSWEAATLPPLEAFPKAHAAAKRALELDPTLAEAHAPLAYASTHYLWRWDEAEREFRHAIALNPNYSHTHHWYSHYLMAVGRADQSLVESQRALALDPVDIIINVHLAWHYWLSRQWDEVIEQCHKTLELDPHDHWPPFFLGLAYGHKGMFDAAVAEHRKAVPLSGGSPVMLGALGYTYALAGQRAEACEVLDRLASRAAAYHVSSYEIGVIQAALGEADRAFDWLDRAYEERSAWLAYLKVDPRLDGLRTDERFGRLLAAVGLGERTPERSHPA